MSAKINKFLKYWLPVFCWAGLIFYLSAVPNLNSGLVAFWDVFLRKLAHSLEFAILNVLIWRGWRGYQFSIKKALALAFILTVLYAFSDEAHQYFVVQRQAKITDVGIDSLGILLASLAILLVSPIRKMETKTPL